MAYTPPAGNDADLIFANVYTPPSALAADMDFFEAEWELRQIWTDEDYVYAATSQGLDIYSILDDSSVYAYVTYSGGFNTVWGNTEKVFVGTSTSGIKYLNKTCISGAELSSCLNDFNYDLTSDNVAYLHGYGDNILCVTDSGVDFVKPDPQGLRSYTVVSGAQKCFLTSNKLYYTISGSEWSLNRVGILCDWTVPDASYTTGSGIFESGIKINDIFVTEHTGYDSISNTIFAATSSGVYVIDEYDLNYAIYYKE